MSKIKIAVLGASGFVGSTLCERLFFEKKYDYLPLIHSFGNAARLSRFPIELKTVDLLNFEKLKGALLGCDIIVNCSRGGSVVLIKGLENLIKAAKKCKIKRFVHIGSLAIYGDDPAADSQNEEGSPNPGSNYGILKLKQDKMIFDLHKSGIPSIILSPSNISGPYSPFVYRAVQKLLSGQIVLVDEGKYPSNLVHVSNLVEAILTIIEKDTCWGDRYFVNEVEQTTWKEFYEELNEMCGINYEFQYVSREKVLDSLANNQSQQKNKLLDNVKILFSGEFRDALAMIPFFRWANEKAYNFFKNLNPELQMKFRKKLEQPIRVKEEKNSLDLTQQFVKVQTRKIYHSPAKLIKTFNYEPKLSYEQRIRTTKSWLKFANII